MIDDAYSLADAAENVDLESFEVIFALFDVSVFLIFSPSYEAPIASAMSSQHVPNFLFPSIDAADNHDDDYLCWWIRCH